MSDCEKAFENKFGTAINTVIKDNWEGFQAAWEIQNRKITSLVEMVDAEKQSYWDLNMKLQSAKEVIKDANRNDYASHEAEDRISEIRSKTSKWLKENK